jgi:hypothetical protein
MSFMSDEASDSIAVGRTLCKLDHPGSSLGVVMKKELPVLLQDDMFLSLVD